MRSRREDVLGRPREAELLARRRSWLRALVGHRRRGLGVIFLLGFGCADEAVVSDGFCVPITTVYLPYPGPSRDADTFDCAAACGAPPWVDSRLAECIVVESDDLEPLAPDARGVRARAPWESRRRVKASDALLLRCSWGTMC